MSDECKHEYYEMDEKMIKGWCQCGAGVIADILICLDCGAESRLKTREQPCYCNPSAWNDIEWEEASE